MGAEAVSRRELRQAGERLLQAVLGDDKLVALLVEAEIARRIDDGELVPKEKLVLGAATVVPTDELEGLRDRAHLFDDGIYRAQLALDAGDMRAAQRILEEVRPADDLDEPEDGEDQAIVRTPPPGSDVDVTASAPTEVATTGKPAGMPDMALTHSCSNCDDNNVPGLQAQLSWTRWRVLLCRPCMIERGGAGSDDGDEEEPPGEQTTVA